MRIRSCLAGSSALRWVAEHLLAALVVLAAPAARAHTPASERSALLQVDEQGVAVLVTVSVRGPHAELLVAMHDRGRDGLDDAEAAAVAEALVIKAARDLSLVVDGTPRVMSGLTARLHDATPGASVVEASGLLTFEGVPEREVVLSAETPRAPVRVEARALGALRFTSTDRGRIDLEGRALAKPVRLRPGTALTLAVGRR